MTDTGLPDATRLTESNSEGFFGEHEVIRRRMSRGRMGFIFIRIGGLVRIRIKIT
jgi:hypothetical protein